MLRRSKSAATLKNKHQQFSILQDRQGSTESLVSANTQQQDRRAKENEEEGQQKLWHGGDLDDSIVDVGDQSLENNLVLTMSQADLQYSLRMWNIEERSKGNEVGESALGRELQKLYPSDVLPPVFYGEVDVPSLSASAPGERIKLATDDDKSCVAGLPITAHYATPSKWQVGSNNPEVQLAQLAAINTITLREGSLLRMLAVVQRLDKHFWEYSLARMKTLALGLPLNTARLIKIRKQMYKLQDEARVAIAHYRGNTLQTVADIQKWKFLCQQETQTKDTVEIMLGNVNYLEKMTRDVEALDDTTVARLWLGHAPTTFMTTSDPQTTLNPSILDERAIRIEFLEKAILDAAEYLPSAASASASASISASASVTAAAATAIAAAAAEAAAADDGSALGLDLDDEQQPDSTNAKEPTTEEAEAEAEVSASTVAAVAEWKILRDFCVSTWGTLRTAAASSEGVAEDAVNPEVAKCCLGFPEIVPKAPLLPALPDALQDRCVKAAAFIRRELRLLGAAAAKERMGVRLRLQVQEEVSSQVSPMRSHGTFEPIKHYMLRKRQETGGREPSSSFRPTHTTASSLSDVFAMTATNSEARLAAAAATAVPELMTDSRVSPWQAAAAAAATAPFSLSQASVFSRADAALAMTTTAASQSKTGGGSVRFNSIEIDRPAGAPLFPKLDAARITSQLEERVVEARTVVEAAPQGSKVLRPGALALKPRFDVTKASVRSRFATQIQRIVRGFVGRRRVAERLRLRHRHRMATRIQKYWRGIWGRQRFKRCLREFRIQFLTLRKEVTTKDDSAQKITDFIRYLGEKSVVGEREAALKSPLFAKKQPNPQSVYAPGIAASPRKGMVSKGKGKSKGALLLQGEEEPLEIEVLSEREREELLRPYRATYGYRDVANEIKDEASIDDRGPKNLLGLLDTRKTSRLLFRPKGRLQPFAARGRTFLKEQTLISDHPQEAGFEEVPRSLAGEPHKVYIVPPSLATNEERAAIVSLLESSSTVHDLPPAFDLRAIWKSK